MNSTLLHTAQAKSVGGRDGQIISDDNVINLEVTMPRHLGGRGREGATNPEQLFAAGYAACFGNAVISVARQQKLPISTVAVDARVDLTLNHEQLPTLAVALHVNLPDINQHQAEAVIASAHQFCPYSRAIRGNVDVAITTTTNPA